MNGREKAKTGEQRVIFKCKYCQLLFLKPADLIEHKQLEHLDEIGDQNHVERNHLSSPSSSSHSRTDDFQAPRVPSSSSSSKVQPGPSTHSSSFENFSETDEDQGSFDSSEQEEEEEEEEEGEELFDSASSQSYSTLEQDGFKCKYCLKDFPHQTLLHTHQKNCPALKILIGKANSYPCKTCHQKFPSIYYLRKHLTENHGDGTAGIYDCLHCPQSFVKRKQLMAHLNCHIGQLQLKPDEVQFPSPVRYKLKPKRIPETDDLIAEKVMGRKFRIYRCMLCNHSLTVRKTPDAYRSRIRSHVRSLHLVFPAETATTHPLSSSSSPSKNAKESKAKQKMTNMQNNSRIDMQTGSRARSSLNCPTCKLEFQTLAQRLDHEEGHEGNLPFLCTKCGQWFRYASYIKNHLRQQH